jgi:hypothetical protein
MQLVGFFNSISYSKDEVTQYSRLKDISIQKVRMGVFSLANYGRTNALGEILLYNDCYMG